MLKIYHVSVKRVVISGLRKINDIKSKKIKNRFKDTDLDVWVARRLYTQPTLTWELEWMLWRMWILFGYFKNVLDRRWVWRPMVQGGLAQHDSLISCALQSYYNKSYEIYKYILIWSEKVFSHIQNYNL